MTLAARIDAIYLLLTAPLMLMLIAAFVIGMAYVSGLLDGLVRLVDRHIDQAFRTDQIRKGETK